MEEYLLSIGFEKRLPWQFINDHYLIVELEKDSYDLPLWSITSLRYNSVSFRGRIRDVEEFKQIFMLVKEDYNLTDEELNKLRGGRNGISLVS